MFMYSRKANRMTFTSTHIELDEWKSRVENRISIKISIGFMAHAHQPIFIIAILSWLIIVVSTLIHGAPLFLLAFTCLFTSV